MQLKEKELDIIFTVGSIDLTDDNYLVEFKASLSEGLNNCDITIKGSEGPIPHCHIKSKDGKFQCCPCLYEPLYFNHAEYQDKLSKNQKTLLNDWMSRPNKDESRLTNWEILCLWWKQVNPIINIPKIEKQPDYTKLKNMIG